MFRSRLLKLLLVSAIACCAIVGFYAPAFASHHTSWITVMAPFSGYWNKANFAPPATHPAGLIPGDWATDYYAVSGTLGRWHSVNTGETFTAKIGLQNNACDRPAWTDAGIRYRVDIYNSSSTRVGWWAFVHVDPSIPGQGQYWLGPGSTLSQGMIIGSTHFYSPSITGCWEVNNDAGVHWHTLGYNEGIGAGSAVAEGSDGLGAVNSNALSYGSPCW